MAEVTEYEQRERDQVASDHAREIKMLLDNLSTERQRAARILDLYYDFAQMIAPSRRDVNQAVIQARVATAMANGGTNDLAAINKVIGLLSGNTRTGLLTDLANAPGDAGIDARLAQIAALPSA